MMALRHSVRIFVSAMLLGLPCVGNAEGEELSSEEMVLEMAQNPHEKGLKESFEEGLISDCPGNCNNFAPSGPYPPEFPPDRPPALRFPLQPSPSGPQNGSTRGPATPPLPAPPAPAPMTPFPSGPPHLFQPQSAPSFSDAGQKFYPKPTCTGGRGTPPDGFTINFDNISIVQLIQFISKISGSNFIYNAADLRGPDGQPLSITIVSEDPASVDDLSAALLQVLKMNNLSVTEQGNNVLIYRNQNMSKVSRVITDNNVDEACGNAVITRVFQLFNVDPTKIAAIVKTLVSPEANVEPSTETRHLIVTDITANVNKIADLLQALDTPQLSIDVFEYTIQSNADPICLAGHAREILEPLAAGSTFSITPEATSQKIFIVSTPFIIEKARRILASLDMDGISCLEPLPPPITELKNNSFYMYKLKYQNGQDIAFALHEIGINLQSTGVSNIDFVNTIFSVQWLPVNNSVVIAGTDDSIQKVVALIDDLDTLPKQVYLEVLILDTSLTNSLDFGVQWIALGDEQNKLAYGTGLLSNAAAGSNFQANARDIAGGVNNVTHGPPAVPNPGNNLPLPIPSSLVGLVDPSATSAFGLGIIGNIIRHKGRSFLTLGALISALDEEADTSIVLNPKIMVEDTQPANFFVGQNIPYQTTSTVIQQTGSVTQNIQYEDIGIDLQITPTISPDNMVTLLINQTVARVQGIAGASNLTPTTDKILATTRVHVPDGTFLVMSGHVSDEVNYIRSGIPCLGTLPLIGPVFSRTIEQRRKRNLIFFIRPQVVTSPEGGVRLSDEEGYQHNWDANPCSIFDCGPMQAPECQIFPITPEMQH